MFSAAILCCPPWLHWQISVLLCEFGIVFALQTYFKNDDDDTPLLVALKAGHDEVAARIMQSMKPAEYVYITVSSL